MILTIEREFGSGGLEIGKILSKHYGIRLYDAESLLDAAKGMSEFDEVRSFLMEEPVNSLIYAIAMSELIEERGKIPFAAMKKIASENDCIIMGRCGNHIFQNDERLTSIFIHADLDLRIQRIARDYQLSESKAKILIEKTDRHRSSFYKYYTSKEWADMFNFHLSIDSGKLGIAHSAGLIIDYIDKRRAFIKDDETI